MALRDGTAFIFSITTASGTTVLINLSGYVDTFNGFKINAPTQETHGFGDAWVEHTFVGVRNIEPQTVGGFYNDVAASGPHVLFGTTSVGQEREVELAFDSASGEIVHYDVIIKDYSIMPVRNELTRFEVTLQPTGSYTTAT